MTRRTLFSTLAGEHARLEDVFRLASPALHGYIQKRLHRAADVPDLTQEIFERFLRSDWQARARNPQAYLFGIASHVVADAYLATQRNPVTFDSELSEKASEALSGQGADDPSHYALRDELQRALELLSDTHRAALLLTKRDGLTCKEAAAKMHTTEGSVRVYVCEARARLKVLLKQGEARR